MAPREFLFITTSSIWTDVFANDTEALLLQISWAVNGWGLWCPFSSLHVLSFPFNSFSSLQFPLISFHSFHFLSFRFIAFRFLSFPHFLSFPFIAFHCLSFPFISFHCLSFPFMPMLIEKIFHVFGVPAIQRPFNDILKPWRWHNIIIYRLETIWKSIC